MSLKSLSALAVLASLTVAFPSLATSAAADDMEWQFYEANEPDNKGAMTARLVYGVPETDDVQVTGVCDARPSTGVKFSSVTFGADIGDLANGEGINLRFSGGGFERTLHGNIERAENEGVSGVHLDIEHNDPLWTAFAGQATLDYMVPGYRAVTLNLAPGRDKLKTFVETCRIYAEVVLGSNNKTATASSSGNVEKDAFGSAKELGTIPAYEAFISNYGSSFYADLARAYIDKLRTENTAASQPVAPPPAVPAQTPPPPPPAPVIVVNPTPADPSCQNRQSLRSQNSNTPTTLTLINSSGMYRSVLWLDFNGQPKDYAGLNDGEQLTLSTFMTHPWMIADGPGDCIEIVMPHAGARTVTLGGTHKTIAPAPKPKPKKASPPKKKKATTKCRSRSVLIDGKCILKRNAQSYCGPGYRLKGNKCVQGYAKPKPQLRLPTWQVEGLRHGCSRGLAWNADEGCHEND